MSYQSMTKAQLLQELRNRGVVLYDEQDRETDLVRYLTALDREKYQSQYSISVGSKPY